MVPALFSRIPGNGQALQPTAGKGDQVLLQGKPAEGVGDFEITHFAPGTGGTNEKFAVPAKKPGGNAQVLEDGIAEITQHGLVGGHIHGAFMVRPLPLVVFLLVAVAAGLAAYEGGRGIHRRTRRRGRPPALDETV
jgi:hypothetical protein